MQRETTACALAYTARGRYTAGISRPTMATDTTATLNPNLTPETILLPDNNPQSFTPVTTQWQPLGTPPGYGEPSSLYFPGASTVPPVIDPFAVAGDLQLWVNKIVAWAIVIVVLAALFYVFYAGWIFITSAGDSEKIEKAYNTLRYTVQGLFIVFLSAALVSVIAGIFGLNFVTELLDLNMVWNDIRNIIGTVAVLYSVNPQ